MENKIESVFLVINDLFKNSNKREILITITNDEFLELHDKMKDFKYRCNSNTRDMQGIHGNVSTFQMGANLLHFKIQS